MAGPPWPRRRCGPCRRAPRRPQRAPVRRPGRARQRDQLGVLGRQSRSRIVGLLRHRRVPRVRAPRSARRAARGRSSPSTRRTSTVPIRLRRPCALSAVSSRPSTTARAPGIGTRPRCLASRPPTVSTSSSSSSTPKQLGQLVDVQPGADPQRSRPRQLLDERLLHVVLVGDLADDLLDDVLDRDQAGGAAVLVDDDRDVGLLAPASRAAARRPACCPARRPAGASPTRPARSSRRRGSRGCGGPGP